MGQDSEQGLPVPLSACSCHLDTLARLFPQQLGPGNIHLPVRSLVSDLQLFTILFSSVVFQVCFYPQKKVILISETQNASSESSLEQ